MNKKLMLTAYIIKCGFGADNQGLQPASASVLFDRKATRNPHLIIYAERYHTLKKDTAVQNEQDFKF